MITCSCGGRFINCNSGRRWCKTSGDWKYIMKCKECGNREVFYADPTGQVKEVGARPTGRPGVELRL